MPDTSTLMVLGLPAFLAAIAYCIKKLADARLVNAQAAKTKAETAQAKVKVDAKDADITGQIVIGREADAGVIRSAFANLQSRLDRSEAKYEDAERRHERERETWRQAMATKDAQIDALWKECRDLRQAIESMQPS